MTWSKGPAAGPAKRRTVPTELAALAMGVSQATIRKWASRGKITRHGGPQRAEYDLDELLALARRGEAA
ncbi:transcriptional regulator [Streptomyces sp. NPDC020490]|uniref:transcriptional regulator n=1 Tax=Streptomyces sp. NPDC020490 TaxID=3365078 RepID=UPI0037A17388